VIRSSDWLRQAERDLAAAQNAAAAGFHEWAAFAAQQSAEKAAKALVESRHGSARGHSTTAILRQIPLDVPEAVLDAARELDQVYVTARYPNGFASGAPADYFTETTSQRLLADARSVVDFCRSAIH
jgi:HEPN domain-containing protein